MDSVETAPRTRDRPHIKASEDDMLAKRQEGYNNARIAEFFGCSVVRVYQLIGAQPKHLRKNARRPKE